ncbi:hypothetical protein NQ314_014681, partial [Rhamnusium bicolor]
YCNGGDLADYLSAKGTLSEDTIRIFLIQLGMCFIVLYISAGAMKALYVKGIVHRDLKPQNILLSHSGAKVHPQPSEIKLKIADFGFARFLQDGVMAATLCGSPMYMAPEVIMSMQYDAKADLWSLGTIVFQCLTGKAPFQANTPQALKLFYEKNANLAPKIPSGTSPELNELLVGLLKRNSRERMNFETFFNHKFLQRPEAIQSQSPLHGELPIPIYGSPPQSSVKLPLRSSTPIKVATPPISQPESPRSTRTALSSSPEDDYVIVPQNIQIQSDQSTESSVEKEKPSFKLPVTSSPLPCGPVASPTRPSFLPISEPIPVPTQRDVFQRLYSQSDKKEEPQSPTKLNNSIPRSAPITMIKRPERQSTDIDISSMSPPSVQFVIGTPPGGRRRSTSVSGAKNMPMNSPLRRSGNSFTLREHNETLAKINFVLALSNCILDLAAQRSAPLAALVDPSQQNQPMSEASRRAEQLVLLVRALQLLSSGLALATRQLKSGQLRPSTTVKTVVSTLNTKFRTTLQECKQLNSTGLLNKVGSTSVTADKILYNHAIQMCQSAALDELFGNPEECFQRYQTAQILLHSLSQQVHNQQDRLLLTKYKDAVEKRLYVLQQQGYIYATDLS